MQIKINSAVIECLQGNIVNQPGLEAVVNAANARLQPGGGVAGALHREAGPQLSEAGRKYAPIKPGAAVITPAFNLPNDYVIHCLGPVYGRDKPEDKLLANCYSRALKLAEENNISSIGFPAISTGAFGYPLEEAAEVALETVISEISALKTVELIRFVLYDSRALKIYEKILPRKT
ncbi:MAG: macro domain-containing protein [bacterium]